MRYRLSTFLLLTALIAVSIGWIVSERRHAGRRNNDLLFLHELARFRANNSAYRSADAFFGTADYQITKDRVLINSIKVTYRIITDPAANGGASPSEEYRTAFLNAARDSCSLLDVKSVSDFLEREMQWSANHPDMPTGPPELIPNADQLTPDFAKFLDELFASPSG